MLVAMMCIAAAVFAGGSAASMVKGAHAVRPLSGSAIPPLYQVVQGADTNIPAGQRWYGTSTCPSGTSPVGGGSYSYATDLGVSMGGTFLDTSTWYSIYNNADQTDSSIAVYAVCMAPVSGFTYQTTEEFQNPRTHLHLVATCPAGSEVLGGGVTNGDDNGLNHLGEHMSSSYPVKSGSGASATYAWAVDMNNTYKAVSVDVVVSALCAPVGSVKGYHLYKGPAVFDGPLTQGNAQMACPATKAPLSGGVRTLSTVKTVTLNSTYPFGISWGSYVNNPTLKDIKLIPYVICA